MLSNSRGRLFAGCLIGIACGLTLPLLSVFSAWVLPVTVIFAFLWVWAGWPSVLVGAAGVMLIGSPVRVSGLAVLGSHPVSGGSAFWQPS